MNVQNPPKDKKLAVAFRLNALNHACAAGRETPLKRPPGQHSGVVYRGDFEVEICFDVEVEPAQKGGWDDPSWDASASAHNAYFRRKNGLWYSIELTDEESEDLGAEFISNCEDDGRDQDDDDDRWSDSDYDAAQAAWERRWGY